MFNLLNMENAKKARRLLRAGSSLKAVLVDRRIPQSAVVAKTQGPLTKDRVSSVLSGGAVAKRQGDATRLTVYQAAAFLLGLRVEEIPEAADLLIRR